MQFTLTVVAQIDTPLLIRQHIVGVDVAMGHPLLMHVLQGRGQPGGVAQHKVHAVGAAGRPAATQEGLQAGRIGRGRGWDRLAGKQAGRGG